MTAAKRSNRRRKKGSMVANNKLPLALLETNITNAEQGSVKLNYRI